MTKAKSLPVHFDPVITYLKVRNLAIVEELAIEPGPALNVLTGETGAGKSLLIDSLEFLRGARSSTEIIRTGTDKMSAEAIFDLPPSVAKRFEEMGVDDTAEIIVKREIATGGRGRVLVNGSALSVRELAEAMDEVLEVHGQSESHQRVAGQTFRQLVDEYGGHDELLETTRIAYGAWREAADQLRELSDAQRDRSLRLDLLKYQVDEISAAKLGYGEEETLRSERSILAHAAEMIEATSGAFSVIDDDESSALTQLARAAHLLQPLSHEITDLKQIADDLHDVTYRLQDIARTLRHLSDSVRHDPARLEAVEERLAMIERLNRKYGGSIAAVLDHLSKISDEYERLSDYEGSIEKLQQLELQRRSSYRKSAEKLSSARRKAAESFQKAIETELRDLAMERTALRIEVASDPDTPHADGFDRIEILVSPNRGEELRPLLKIASGGELSRIQLAIAAALFKRSLRGAAATLVFDEIDAGIGGRVAEVVGRKLRELSAANQVICVTHLPQIASFGSTHFYVWKEEVKGQTRARVRRLDTDEERVTEIARMLGGEKVAASAIAHARELLGSAHARAR
ncbi:MAG TPA: DNA repair protein RecN [Thermoanaerobaculia bacterium]|jgi:DNA repair protein RecN (Recombination protein N)|nr:DNA repair protein RecN [Thermoanaerobaculia bacterium]